MAHSALTPPFYIDNGVTRTWISVRNSSGRTVSRLSTRYSSKGVPESVSLSFLAQTVMKSVDYLKHGLPLLSNIPADTQRLIAEKHIGVQVTGDGVACAAAVAAMGPVELLALRENARQAFSQLFDLRVICARYETLLSPLWDGDKEKEAEHGNDR